MKNWIVFMLLLIATAGTFIPCCLVDDCPSDQTSSENHAEGREEGVCSPFFACTTCPGFVHTVKTPQLAEPELLRQVHQPALASFMLSEYSDTLLDPPRLA